MRTLYFLFIVAGLIFILKQINISTNKKEYSKENVNLIFSKIYKINKFFF